MSTRASKWPGAVLVAGAFAVLAWSVHEGAQRVLPGYWPSSASEGTPAGEGVRVTGPAVRNFEYDISRMVNAHLFGQANRPAERQVTRAPETKLRLNLIGLIASADDRLARAIIGVNNSGMKPYAIGQLIDGTDAALHAVEDNRVLLKRGDALESLKLKRKEIEVRQRLQPGRS